MLQGIKGNGCIRDEVTTNACKHFAVFSLPMRDSQDYVLVDTFGIHKLRVDEDNEGFHLLHQFIRIVRSLS